MLKLEWSFEGGACVACSSYWLLLVEQSVQAVKHQAASSAMRPCDRAFSATAALAWCAVIMKRGALHEQHWRHQKRAQHLRRQKWARSCFRVDRLADMNQVPVECMLQTLFIRQGGPAAAPRGKSRVLQRGAEVGDGHVEARLLLTAWMTSS